MRKTSSLKMQNKIIPTYVSNEYGKGNTFYNENLEIIPKSLVDLNESPSCSTPTVIPSTTFEEDCSKCEEKMVLFLDMGIVIEYYRKNKNEDDNIFYDPDPDKEKASKQYKKILKSINKKAEYFPEKFLDDCY